MSRLRKPLILRDVAFIPDAPLLEIAVVDAHQGVVFYAISQRPAERPQIVRSDSCLSCHEGHDTHLAASSGVLLILFVRLIALPVASLKVEEEA